MPVRMPVFAPVRQAGLGRSKPGDDFRAIFQAIFQVIFQAIFIVRRSRIGYQSGMSRIMSLFSYWGRACVPP
jgi:hypothetical protein